MINRTAFLAMMLACGATPALAQLGPTPLGDTPVVDELIVRATGGPPWWKVSDGDTTVYILADPGLLPPGLEFDRTRLNRYAQGANEIIIAPRFGDGLFEKFVLASPSRRIMKALNSGEATALEPSLPPAIRKRFTAARARIGQPETRYGGLPPGLAGMALAGDSDEFRKVVTNPNRGTPTERIVKAAGRAGKVPRYMPARTWTRKELLGIYDDLYKPGLPCLISSLDALDALPPNMRDPQGREKAIRAWADGDVRPMLQRLRAIGSTTWFVANSNGTGERTVRVRFNTAECIDAMPTVKALSASWIPDQTAAVVRALKKPGKAIAVYEPSALLRQDGILDRLRKQGFTVTAPDGAD